MPKPRDTELRCDILSALDRKPVCTIQDIKEHLIKIKKPKPEHTIRFTVKAMCKEGLLKVFKRGEHNRAFYVKAVFPNTTTLINFKGEPVTLMQFISELDGRDSHPLLSDTALELMKSWMLNAIAVSDKKAYLDKRIDPPDPLEIKRNLEQMKRAIEMIHRFVKAFIDTDVWSNVGHDRVKKELDGLGITAVIVDRHNNSPVAKD
jgi:hypothetical protein